MRAAGMKSPSLLVLRRRSEFLSAAASGVRFVKPSLIVQRSLRGGGEHDANCLAFGITATKKLGNAVARNRVKRRLRAAVRELLPRLGVPGHNYVFIGRSPALTGAFDDLIRDMKHALKRLAALPAAASSPPGSIATSSLATADIP